MLLLSAVALAVNIRQYPFVHGWLTAKVLGLVAYIVFGAIGLHHGKSRLGLLTREISRPVYGG